MFLFTGANHEIQVPGKETQYCFEAYNTTQWYEGAYERCSWFSIGIHGAIQIWLAEGNTELVIRHDGDLDSQETTCIISPY